MIRILKITLDSLLFSLKIVSCFWTLFDTYVAKKTSVYCLFIVLLIGGLMLTGEKEKRKPNGRRQEEQRSDTAVYSKA